MKRWPAFSQRHLGSLEQAQKLSSCSSRTVGPFLPAREENADVHYTSPVEQPDGDPYIARAPFALVFMATCSLHQDPHLKSASATQDDGRTQASPPHSRYHLPGQEVCNSVQDTVSDSSNHAHWLEKLLIVKPNTFRSHSTGFWGSSPG